MPTTWDAELDRKLLLVALDPANKPDWAAVATAMGADFTSEGVRQHYAKLKKEAVTLGGADPSTTGTDAAAKATTPKTPRKRKAAGMDTPGNTPKKARTPRKKKAEPEANDDDSAPVADSSGTAAAEPKVEKEEETEEDNNADTADIKKET
ncbi:hypothetical protein FQN54_007747 [Arachnomyces sp. PD_36]|nr:hypothetical protein FQN54_007747 [Arachnomyces sp. PD_36]